MLTTVAASPPANRASHRTRSVLHPNPSASHRSRAARAARLALLALLALASSARAAYRVQQGDRTATLRTVVIGREEMVALDDVVSFFQFQATRDSRKEQTLTRPEGSIRLRAGRALVFVNDQPFLLEAEIRQDEGEFYVPVGFVTRAVGRLLGTDGRLDEATRSIRFGTPTALFACETFDDRTRVTLTCPRPPEFSDVVRDGPRRILEITNQDLPAQTGGCSFNETITDLQVVPSAGRARVIFTVGPRFASLKVYELPDTHQLVFDFLNDSTTGTIAPLVAPPASPGDVFDTVVLDPGHGGEDLGAVSPGGLREKDLALAIARETAQLLRERAGLNVILTRDADRAVPLADRTTAANEARADLFLSIHANATMGPNAWGAETYFLHVDATDEASRTVAALENDATGLRRRGAGGDDLEILLWDMAQQQYLEESSRLAEAVQQELNELAGTRDRGVKQANFLVLRGATMPAVLVEVGFLSNPRDEQRMRKPDFQHATAEALYRAVVAFRDQRRARQQR